MADEYAAAIRRRLDEELVSDQFDDNATSTADAGTRFFQNLFVDVLDFEETPSADGDVPWRSLAVHELSQTANVNVARLVARAGKFRVVYVELDSLTRAAERSAVQSFSRVDQTDEWATGGTFLAVFSAPGEDVWHLVTPYDADVDDITVGRLVLRRFTLGAGATHRTVANALANIARGDGRLEARIRESFSVEPVTEEFYEDYKRSFEALQTDLRESGLDADDARRHAHVTLTRLLSVYYLQTDGWIGGRTNFVRWFHDQYRSFGTDGTFYDTWLSALFFEGLNRPEGAPIAADVPSKIVSVLSDVPYVDGGIFRPTGIDEGDISPSDAVLTAVVRGFLERYNFTVTEESPYDIDVAVDPAMLGKIYESLVAEQERDEAGIFYTPRTEVDLMCRMALYEQCRERVDIADEASERELVEFVFSDPQQWSRLTRLDDDALATILHDVRVVDPACGSGAFLVGMKQVLSELFEKLGRVHDIEIERHIVERTLYGVDIKEWAVNVAEFRLWLSLVGAKDHYNQTRPVFPTLSCNLRTGDSLVDTVAGSTTEPRPDPRDGPEERRDEFAWHLDFSDVMSEGGFDIVLTNPPYVDHQSIVKHHSTHDGHSETNLVERRSLKSTYKDELVSSVRERFDIEPYRRSDLYLYFFFKAIDVLRDGGTLSFITSNTWLDTSYGKRLQQGLLELTDLNYVVDNREKRSFASADVNTAITVANKTCGRNLTGDVSFVALAAPYERVVSPTILENLFVTPARDQLDEFTLGTERGRIQRFDGHRVVRLDEQALWRLGGGTTAEPELSAQGVVPSPERTVPTGTYSGTMWGQFIRAPTTYFELLEAGADVFTPLSEIATVRSYLNTGGADEFFFVALEDGDPRTDRYVTIRNRTADETFTVESEFVVPFVESPRHVSRIDLSKAEYDTYLVSIPEETDLAGTRVREYVKWGEAEGRAYHTTSGRRKAAKWWVLGPRAETNTKVVWPNRQSARHFVAYNPDRTVTHRFYRLDPHDGVGVTPEELTALLNFSPTALFTDVLASAGLGLGVLDVTGTTLRRVPVVDPRLLSAESTATICDAFRVMSNREMGTLHDELGSKTADGVSRETVASDRTQLDRELFETYLGLDEDDQTAVYAAIIRTLNDRLDKSRSV